MSSLEMKSLVKTAKELNTVMCLEPKIKLIGVSKEDLEEAISVNAEDIHWEDGVDEDGDAYEADSFSDETLAVLDALGVGDPANKVKKAPKKTKAEEIDEAENEDNVVKARADKDKAKKADTVPEKKTSKKTEPEPEDEDGEEADPEDLAARLQVAKKMDDLNEIISDFPDVFTKKVVKGLAEFKNPIMLKKAMKEAAGIAPAEKVEKVKKEKTHVVSRPEAVGLALKENPKLKSINEWAEAANAIYTKSGGASDVPRIKRTIIIAQIIFETAELPFPVKK
jgi:hypothetical protein